MNSTLVVTHTETLSSATILPEAEILHSANTIITVRKLKDQCMLNKRSLPKQGNEESMTKSAAHIAG